MRNIFSRKKDKKPKLRKPINFRKWTRFIFRLLLIGLIVSSCVQSLTWMGSVSIHKNPRYVPEYYDDTYSSRRSSTRYIDIPEVEVDTTQVTREVEEPPYNDYNRNYTNGRYR